VFCNELGVPINPGWLTARFTTLRKAASIPTGSLHILRHTAATLMQLEGVPLHVVAGRLGDDPRTILSTYAHLLPHSDAEAVATVATVIDGVAEIAA
jgi:integrase